jgi:hypothetical protein
VNLPNAAEHQGNLERGIASDDQTNRRRSRFPADLDALQYGIVEVQKLRVHVLQDKRLLPGPGCGNVPRA